MTNYLTEQSIHNSAVEREEINLVATIGLKPFIDGDKWCVLWGENIMNGVAGFGETPYAAVLDFNKNFHNETAPKKEKP